MHFLLLALVALVAPANAPEGMELLYGNHIPTAADGEPWVTLGVVTGEKRLSIRATTIMRVDFFEAGTPKQAQLPAGTALNVVLGRSLPAKRAFYVDLEAGLKTSALAAQLKVWQQRGFGQVTALDEGAAVPLGRVSVDTRRVRLVLPVRDMPQGARLAAALNRRYGLRASVKQRLAERPWAELWVSSPSGPLGVAASYVRITADNAGLLEIADVEYARGYSWHGQQARRYRDTVYAVVDADGMLAAVNALGAESVLKGVVPAEMYASAPAEALKAQAVAARNTLFAKLGGRHVNEPFQLCAEQHCQVYAGADKEDPRTNQAVRSTVGEVLFHSGQIVDAVYSANCGGHTEDNEAVWGDKANPALRGRPDLVHVNEPSEQRFSHGLNDANIEAFVRSQPESFCAAVPRARPDMFRWQKTLEGAALQTLLQRAHPGLGPLRSMQMTGRGRGGRLHGIRLVGAQKTVVVARELPIRKLFGNLNSAAFTWQERRDAQGFIDGLTLTGGGWGHGVGMCQIGAIGRAEQAQSYAQILAYYYSGAQLRRMYGGQGEVAYSRSANLTSSRGIYALNLHRLAFPSIMLADDTAYGTLMYWR